MVFSRRRVFRVHARTEIIGLRARPEAPIAGSTGLLV